MFSEGRDVLGSLVFRKLVTNMMKIMQMSVPLWTMI